MKRRNYTREILDRINKGQVPVATVLGVRVQYAPRRKTDPAPWTDGFYRWSGREIHTVAPCDALFGLGKRCNLPAGHDVQVVHRVIPVVRYHIG